MDLADFPRQSRQDRRIRGARRGELPLGAERIAGVLREFDRQPERLVEGRRHDMVQMLLHHDWAYRW